MSDRRRQGQQRLLAILLVVLAVLVTWRWLQSSAERGARGARARSGGSAALAELDIPQLELERLERQPADYAPGRDLFRFVPKAAPPPPPRAEPPPQPVRRRPQRRRPQRAEAATPATPPKPQPPAIDFTYLGSFGPPDRRIAVFVRGDEIYNVVAGGILMDRFIVDKIGFESADIKFVGFPDVPEKRLVAGG